MNKFIAIVVLLISLLVIKSCTKDEPDVQYIQGIAGNLDNTAIVTNRYGLNTNTKVLFLESVTVSNYLIDTLREYIALNAEYIDSFVLKKVSQSHANIYYTNNDKFDAANYDIKILYKGGKIDTLLGYLAPYKGEFYTYKPDQTKDLLYKCKANKVVYKQKKAFKPYQLHHIDYTGKVYIWEVYKDSLLVTKDYIYPYRTEDYEFILNNKP